MPSTTLGFPYPAGTDDPDIPGDLRALAEAINAEWGQFGTGGITIGGDTGLYRSNVDALATNDKLIVIRPAAGSHGLGVRVSGDSFDRFRVTAGGVVQIGDGTVDGGDVNLYRSAANRIKTDDSFEVEGDLYLDSDAGRIYFGEAGDGYIYRVNSDGDLGVDGGFYTGGNMVIPSGSYLYFADDAAFRRDAATRIRTDADLSMGRLLLDSLNFVGSAVSGTSAKKMQVFDASGVAQGYIPVYPS